MFALYFTYMCGLSIWLGSLIAIRYIIPFSVLKAPLSRDAGTIIALEAIRLLNKLGMACGILMLCSIGLQGLLKGMFFHKPDFAFAGLMICMVGIMELSARRHQNTLSLHGKHALQSESMLSASSPRKIYPATIRMLLLAQIIVAFVLLFLSLF